MKSPTSVSRLISGLKQIVLKVSTSPCSWRSHQKTPYKALGLFTTVLGLNTSSLAAEMFAGCSTCSPISPDFKFSELPTMSGQQGKDFRVRKTCPHVQYLLLPNCVIVDRFVLFEGAPDWLSR